MATDNGSITPIPGIENLTYEDVSILLNAQRLWLELVEWIRNFFRSAFLNLPDQSAVGNELFIRMPEEISREFEKYYSTMETQQFLNIVSRMIAANWQLATAYKNKDKTAMELSSAQLHQISEELASFLAGTNQFLDEKKLKTILHEYVDLRIKEITAFFNGNYESEIEIYQEIGDVVVGLSNYLAMGIITQRHTARRNAFYYPYLE